jgi:hypothetical protein
LGRVFNFRHGLAFALCTSFITEKLPHLKSKTLPEQILGPGLLVFVLPALICAFVSRSSLVRQLTEDGTHHLPAYVPEKAKLCKQTTIMDLETLTLNPKKEGRIIELTPKVYNITSCFD